MTPFRSRPHADKRRNFISTDFLSFVPPLPLRCSVHKLWMADSQYWARASSFWWCHHLPSTPRLPPRPPPLHLFCLGQFGPGGAPLQNRAWSILGKPGLLIAWLRVGRSALLATWSSSEHVLLPAIVGVKYGTGKVLHLHRSSDETCALKYVRLASFLKQMKTDWPDQVASSRTNRTKLN